MPFFSIILPTYNRERLLIRAIQSVLDQKFQDWELIIIDDGSTDNTKDVVFQFADNRLRYVYQENQGRSITRNIGISQAKGEWVCFLDSDDWYTPDHLDVFNNQIKISPKSTVFKTGVQFVDENKMEIFKSVFITKDDIPLNFFCLNYSSILDLCISRKTITNASFPNISTWEDKAFILDLLFTNDVHQIQKRTVIAYEHEGRSILKGHENPSEINSVLQVMKSKIGAHNASSKLVDKVQQNFLLSILTDAQQQKESQKKIKALIEKLEIKPSLTTRLKLLKARIFNT